MAVKTNFEVTPTLANGQVTWSVCDDQVPKVCTSPGSVPDVLLPHTWFGWTYKFTFTLTNDQTGLGIVFAPNPPPPTNDGPLWVQASSKPTAPATDPHISDVKGAGTTKLSFKDKDHGDSVDLYYRLNFVDSTGKKVTAIDPEIKNGGSTLFMGFVPLALGVVVLLVLAVTAYRAFTKRTGGACSSADSRGE